MAASPPADAQQRFENLKGRFLWVNRALVVDVDLDWPTPGLSFFDTRYGCEAKASRFALTEDRVSGRASFILNKKGVMKLILWQVIGRQ